MRPTDRSADLTLPVAALGGAHLGGTRLRDLVLATGAGEHRPGALAEADALLRNAPSGGPRQGTARTCVMVQPVMTADVLRLA